jgi:predicted PurR-regulated permease PerM
MNYKILRIPGTLLVILLLFWFLWSVRAVLTPFFIGFIIAYILDPFVDILEQSRIPRAWAIIFIYFFFMGAFFLLIFYALPIILVDLNKLIEAVPEYTRFIQDTIREIQKEYSRVPIPDSIRQVTDETIVRGESLVISLIQGLVQGIIHLFSQSFNFILAPILSFYILKEFNKLGKYALMFIPVRFRAEAAQIAGEINLVLRKFIRGNLLVALLVAILTTLGMYLIGMDFPVLLGIVVGVTNFIPYFGAIIGTIPAFLLALIKSKWLALYVLGVMFLVQQIEGNIISPKVLGDCVGLHPLVIIFALLAGGQLWGLAGLLVAIPLAAISKILLKHIFVRLF